MSRTVDENGLPEDCGHGVMADACEKYNPSERTEIDRLRSALAAVTAERDRLAAVVEAAPSEECIFTKLDVEALH